MGFWKMFKWNKELKKLDEINKAVVPVMNIHLIYCMLVVAFICFVFPCELMNTKLGYVFLLGCSGFWLLRTVNQFIFFKTNGVATYVLTVILLVGVALFALPVFM